MQTILFGSTDSQHFFFFSMSAEMKSRSRIRHPKEVILLLIMTRTSWFGISEILIGMSRYKYG